MTDGIAGALIGAGATAIVAVFTWFAATATAGGQQDREALRRQKGVARALLADLERIWSELGPEGAGGSITRIHSRDQPPTIHPWVEGLITQIAESSPSVVQGFMNLERHLGNFAAFRKSLEHQAKEVGEKRAVLDGAERVLDTAGEGQVYDPLTSTFRNISLSSDGDWSNDAAIEAEYAGLVNGIRRQLQVRDDARGALEEAEKARDFVRSTLHACECYARDDIRTLRYQLSVIAERRLPTLPQLVLRTTIPVSDDADLQRLEDDEILRDRHIP